MKPTNILITGASSGIGEALAMHYSLGKISNLFICGRDEERLEKTKSYCEKRGIKADRIHAKVLDVTNKEATRAWIDECESIAPLDLVIANAGVSTCEEIPENIFNTFNVNVNGVLNTIIPVIEFFKTRHHGQIAIISSIAGYHGLPSCPSYSASKACVKAYGEALRISLSSFNIKVNVVCPGFVRSRITDKNTCPMPFFMETPDAAKIIAEKLEKDVGLIAFPWPMRFSAWFMSVLPNALSDFIYSRLPHKVQ